VPAFSFISLAGAAPHESPHGLMREAAFRSAVLNKAPDTVLLPGKMPAIPIHCAQ